MVGCGEQGGERALLPDITRNLASGGWVLVVGRFISDAEKMQRQCPAADWIGGSQILGGQIIAITEMGEMDDTVQMFMWDKRNFSFFEKNFPHFSCAGANEPEWKILVGCF